MIEVSIITPCFNSSKTIFFTLRSLQNQTFKDFEVIVIDDCSTDDSLQIINSFVSNDSRFKVFSRKKNCGVVSARNLGIKKAKGRFIAFLDSDDVWKNKFLELSLRVHKNNKPGITHAPYYRFYFKNQKFYGQKYYPPSIVSVKNILRRNYMGLSTVIVDTRITGKFHFPNLRPEDYNLWIILISNKIISQSIGSIQAYIRVSNVQRSSNKFKAFLRLRKFYFKNRELSFIMKIFYLISWVIENFKLRLAKRFTLVRKYHQEIF